MSESENKDSERIKNKRTAKKGSITKRINEITQLINDSGSRTKVKFLHSKLLIVLGEAVALDTQLASLVSGHDETWIESEKERVDTVSSDVEEYLQSRADDAASTASLTPSWVHQHTPAVDVELQELTGTAASMHLHGGFQPSNTNYYNHSNVMRPPQFSGSYDLGGKYTYQGDTYSSGQQTYPMSSQFGSTNPQVSFSNPACSEAGALPGSFAHSSITPNQPSHETNDVDSWVDALNPKKPKQAAPDVDDISQGQMMGYFVQQSLPRMEIPDFDGSATLYIEFITKVRDLIHSQPFLTDIQRSSLLVQHLKGEAKQAVKAYSHDWAGYVHSLKRIKFLFGQRSSISRAVITSMTQGKAVQDDDPSALSGFYYNVSDCITTLKQLNYASDLFSTEVLLQTVKRLPRRLVNKWADHGMSLRQRSGEPNLLHFEVWLQARVLSQREACLLENKQPKKHVHTMHGDKDKKGGQGEDYVFWKSDWFKALDPKKKFEKVSRQKRCFNCLKKGHVTEDCSSRGTCLTKGCKKRHHTVLHEYFSAEKPKHDNANNNTDDVTDDAEAPAIVPPAPAEPAPPVHNMMVRGTGAVYLQVVPVVLRTKNRIYRTYALLDNGSQFTLLRDGVARRLKLSGEKGNLEYETVKEKESTEQDQIPTEKVSLSVSSMDGKCSFNISCAYSVSSTHFNMPAQPSPVRNLTGETPSYIEDLDLKSVKPSQISILIGADVAEATLVKEVRRGDPGQPLAVNTMLGWTLYGSSTIVSEQPDGTSTVHVNLVHQPSHFVRGEDIPLPTAYHPEEQVHDNDINLDSSLERFWVQEQSLITPPKENAMSQDDVKALHQLEFGTKMVNDRYEVPMLWKHERIVLPDNYPLARRRFNQLVKRLQADSDLYAKYKGTIEQQIAKGYARKMTEEEVAAAGKRRWILPHHPVFNVNKPGKVRPVMDAAAVFRGASLNSSLVPGPDLLNSLHGILIRFRRDPIAIAGDVEAMFHQVRVSEEDSDSLCFLWTDDIFSDEPPYLVKMLVHIFGATDSMTCCIYALQRAARDNSHLMTPFAFETILRNFYADDLLRSVPSEEVAIDLVKELFEMLKRGGFRLTKFVSNSKAVLDSIPPEEVSPKATLNLDGEVLERVLGVKWDIRTDTFTFAFNVIDAPSTKRGILRITCSLFDPLGFLTPFILIAKLLLQELWRLSFDWDDQLPPKVIQHWEKWKAGAKNVSCVSVPRCFYPAGSSIVEIQLHVFGDASELAYGPVAYLRFTFKDGHHEVSYVMSKSKVAPLKTVTLPRLELNAGLTAVRLYRNIIHEIDLPVEKTNFWTDSTLTYQYITNTKHRFRVYPANRVTEILETSTADQWKLVPGDINPADILTRGVLKPSELMEPNKKDTSWFHGPAFLSKDEEEWPQIDGGVLRDDDPEIKKKSVLVTLGLLFISKQRDTEQIDATRFSSWIKLKRVAGWVLRFIANFLLRLNLSGEFSCGELQDAERFIIKNVQRTAFEEEIELLQSGDTLAPGRVLGTLSPFLDAHGCLRVGGRLRKIALPTDAKHQIILPKDHPVTHLIIKYEHTSNGHIPPEHVLSNLRQRFWIVNGRAVIRNVLKQCFLCQVRRARQMFPFMADLPESRLAYLQPPFSSTGVDLFGPIYIKQGRKKLKRWVALFTCLTVRCIHLEVVHSPDTDDFINALRCFTNRRGRPSNMSSDCGSNFKGAVNELQDLIEKLDKDRIQAFAASKGIVWTFNPPSAPHMGGVWERLVRSVKEVMTGLLQEKVLTDPQLSTLLTEVESILNNRPLTHISTDIEDHEALTPNHILLGLHKNWDCMLNVDSDDVTSRRHWRQVQALSILFWERWVKEYLPELTKRAKWHGHVPNYKVGELVLLSDEQSKRKGRWSLARIIRVMPGDDGIVRTVEVKTKHGTLVRPTSKLYRLEENVNVRQGEGYVLSK